MSVVNVVLLLNVFWLQLSVHLCDDWLLQVIVHFMLDGTEDKKLDGNKKIRTDVAIWKFLLYV